jgi:hypothetical protein
MKHIQESIIGRKSVQSVQISKESISDGDILETRAGVAFVYISEDTWDKNLNGHFQNGVLVNPDHNFNFGWIVNRFDYWAENLTGTENLFDIVKIYKAGNDQKSLFDSSLKMKDPAKRAKLLKHYIKDITSKTSPIHINK